MKQFENIYPHRRKNILTGEWVLVSPQRTKRPWQGEVSAVEETIRPKYEPDCYLCPGNKRANGESNPNYKSTFVFTNDFSSLLEKIPTASHETKNLLVTQNEIGICRVVNFSPRHDLTLAEMSKKEIQTVIETWRSEFRNLSKHPKINHVQIFENKGAIMGNSNPHPHCQIWAQESIPTEPAKELKQFVQYYRKNNRNLLNDYLKLELKLNERIVYENSLFVVLVPFWATWPYETIIISKKKYANMLAFKSAEVEEFADALKTITVKYDNLFKTSFPYSSGIHQAPTDGKPHKEWHFHMHFYPPLLRSASVKKYMVGYEMLAEPQRDITPELSAKVLRELSTTHYKKLKRRGEDV
ncbi:MAG: UDP-glucose--hexose-1-phosphate uridylyltransferase [Ignavibacteria bacterium]|nr:UDP-glucose--hexose-1-phosphate uridylyltransferase [Ignavibacteria bacterium]